jgi:tetratricopeptide (TPR) repeat protein
MRSFVFPDPALSAVAADFVWLALDTEDEQRNAKALAKLTPRGWPNLYVVDPATETPLLRWVGAATAPELVSLLTDVRDSARGATVANASAADAEASAAFLRAERAVAAGKGQEAIRELRAALAAGSGAWRHRDRAAEALVMALAQAKDRDACARTAAGALPSMRPGTSAASVAATGLDCAVALPEGAATKSLVASLTDGALRIADDPAQPILADDRSSLYEEVCGAYEAAKNDEARRKVGLRWARFLEGEAGRAKTKQARAVFDAHRLLAYKAANAEERAIPMLEESERDFPDDYNPPARLAQAYLATGRLDEAERAIERALKRVYGPRAKVLLKTRDEIQAAKARRSEQRK